MTNKIFNCLARSNTDEKAPVFELVAGRTDQTNKQQTFLLTPHGNTAYIRMARPMDYESISEYTLTVRIQVGFYLKPWKYFMWLFCQIRFLTEIL